VPREKYLRYPTPKFWLNLQRGYDLAVTAQDTDLVGELETILPLAS
jgi:plasmid maintenance system antidote protein VapI